MKWMFIFLLLTACNSTPNIKINKHPTFEILIEPEVKPICHSEMTHIEGKYCPKVKNECLNWLDDSSLPYARCKEYKNPSTCLVDKVDMNYCISTEELNDNFGLPYGDKSWNECKKICESRELRLCIESEWVFACSGVDMHPYPYGNGFIFNTTSCNVERKNLVCGKEICDLRSNVNEFPECTSTFGIHNMVGNVDEWVRGNLYYSSHNDAAPIRSILFGGYYGGGRHRCLFSKTVDHDEHFINKNTTGCRCCSNILE